MGRQETVKVYPDLTSITEELLYGTSRLKGEYKTVHYIH